MSDRVIPDEAVTITEFLEARIAEDEKQASYLLRGLEADIAENYAGMVDERGPMTPSRKLHAEMWATHNGQSKTRNFAKGQAIADLANPARVLAECAAKRSIIGYFGMLCEQEKQAEVFGYHATGLLVAIRKLAAVFKDHPDYKEEWQA